MKASASTTAIVNPRPLQERECGKADQITNLCVTDIDREKHTT